MSAVTRIALGIQYDGSAFCGWQSQPHGKTVQDALERALREFAQTPLQTVVAGRTDTGVHGLGQVVHFDTGLDRTDFSWVRGTNAFLPKTVAVQWAKPMPETFHARFSAFERSYYYALYVHPVRSPMLAARAGWVHTPLDVEAMRAATACLIGEHDLLHPLPFSRQRVPAPHGAQPDGLSGGDRTRALPRYVDGRGTGKSRPQSRGAHFHARRPVSGAGGLS
jgi:tRNA pseudouridine38-40 synthase